MTFRRLAAAAVFLATSALADQTQLDPRLSGITDALSQHLSAKVPSALPVALQEAVAFTPAPTQDPKNWDDFNALFGDLILEVPKVHLVVNKTANTYIDIKDLKVSGIKIGDLSISPGGDSLSLGIKTIELNISMGNLDVTLPPLAIGGGILPACFPVYNMSFTNIHIGLDLDLTFTFDLAGTPSYPQGLSLAKCNFALPALDIANCTDGVTNSTPTLCGIIKTLTGYGPTVLPGLITQLGNSSICNLIGKQVGPDSKIGGLLELLAAGLTIADLLEADLPGPLPQGLPKYMEAINKAETILQQVSADSNNRLASFDSHGLIWRGADLILNEVWGAAVPPARQTWPGEVVLDEVLDRYNVGELDIGLGNLAFNISLGNIGEVKLSLLNVSIAGLDKISKLDVAKVVSNHTLSHQIGISELEFGIWLQLDVGPGPSITTSHGPAKGFSEAVQINVTGKDIVVDLITTLGMDLDRLEDLTVRDLLDSKGHVGRGPLSCLLQTFVLNETNRNLGWKNWCGLSLPGMSLHMGDLDLWEVSVGNPGWGAGVDNVLRGAVAGILGQYKGQLINAVPLLADKLIRPVLNLTLTGLVGLETELAPNCYTPPSATATATDFIKFNETPASTTLGIVDFLIEGVMGPDVVGGIDINDASLNAVLRALGNNSGSLVLKLNGSTSLLDLNIVNPLFGINLGHVELSLSNLTATTWNATAQGNNTGSDYRPPLEKVALLLPNSSDPYQLDNIIRTTDGISLNISIDIGLDWTGLSDSDDVHNHFTVTLYALDFDTQLSLHTQIAREKLDALKLGQVVSPSCLVSTMGGANALRLPIVNLAGRRFGAMMECIECNSPMLVDGDLQKHLTSEAGVQQMTQIVNGLFNYIGGKADVPAAHMYLDEIVAAATCPAPAPPPKDDGDSKSFGDIATYVVVAGMCVVTFLVMIIMFALAACKAGGIKKLDWSKTLHNSEAVPLWGKIAVPVGLVAAFTLFVTSHSSWGIEAALVLHLAGDQIVVKNVFHYSLKTAVSDMWDAGVYPLSLLIGVMSGGWVYVKIMILWFFWYMPLEVVPRKSRATGLGIVDYLGKWSLVDMFVFVMFVVAFRLHIVSPESLKFLPVGVLEVDLFIIPHWGLVGFVIAAVLVLAVNHYMVFMEHNVEATEDFAEHEKEQEAILSASRMNPEDVGNETGLDHEAIVARSDSGMSKATTKSMSWVRSFAGKKDREALCRHQFGDDAEIETMSAWMRVALTMGLVIAFAFMVWGAIDKTFSFSFRGLVAPILAYCDPDSVSTDYSIFSLTNNMVSQAGDVAKYVPDISGGSGMTYGNYYFIGIAFLVFTILVPFVQVIVLLAMWVVPMTLSDQKILLFTNSVLAAWSSTEVFIVALFASLLEISQFAAFLIGGACDLINEVMRGPMKAFGVLDDLGVETEKCFDVHTEFKTGVWVLFAAILMVNIIYWILFRYVEHCIAHRELQYREGENAPLMGHKQVQRSQKEEQEDQFQRP